MAGSPFAVVLRISDVALSQSELETALGVSLARHEPARVGPLHYAQVDVDIVARHVTLLVEHDLWAGIVECIERLGPQIQALRNDRRIGRTSIDLAVSFSEDLAVATYGLPSRVARAAGRYGIDIELSVYRGSETDGP
jgi:hypothetical protein